MDQLEQIIRDLPNNEEPRLLHQRIMRRITVRQASRLLIFAGLISVINLFVVARDIVIKASNAEFLSVTRAMLDGLQMTTEYWQQFLFTSLHTLPTTSLTVFVVNLVLVSYIIQQGWKLHQEKIALANSTI